MASSTGPDLTVFKHYADAFIACSALFMVLTTICVGLRFYVRRVMLGALCVDDWLLFVTYCTYIPLCVVELLLGTSIKSTTAAAFDQIVPTIAPLTIAGRSLYSFCQIFLKIALASFFLRIVVRPWHRHSIIASVTVYSLFTLSFVLTYIFSCGVPSWQVLIRGHNCAVSSDVMVALGYTSSALNCLTDWIMALSPLAVLSTLHLPRREKISVLILTLLGLLASVVSVVRIPMLHRASNPYMPRYTDGLSGFIICSQIEIGIGIMALALAALRPLLRSLIAKITTTMQSSYGRGTGGRATASETELNKTHVGPGITAQTDIEMESEISTRGGDKGGAKSSITSMSPVKGGIEAYNHV